MSPVLVGLNGCFVCSLAAAGEPARAVLAVAPLETDGDTGRVSTRISPIEIVVIVLEAFLVLGAIVGAVSLILAPDGSGMGWTTEQLRHTPFDDYLVPGIVLLLANGVVPSVVIVATLRRASWSGWGHLVVGCILVAWIAIQLLLVGYGALIQPLFGALGVVIAGLGLLSIRRARLELGAAK